MKKRKAEISSDKNTVPKQTKLTNMTALDQYNMSQVFNPRDDVSLTSIEFDPEQQINLEDSQMSGRKNHKMIIPTNNVPLGIIPKLEQQQQRQRRPSQTWSAPTSVPAHTRIFAPAAFEAPLRKPTMQSYFQDDLALSPAPGPRRESNLQFFNGGQEYNEENAAQQAQHHNFPLLDTFNVAPVAQPEIYEGYGQTDPDQPRKRQLDIKTESKEELNKRKSTRVKSRPCYTETDPFHTTRVREPISAADAISENSSWTTVEENILQVAATSYKTASGVDVSFASKDDPGIEDAWKQVARHLPDKTPQECEEKWKQLINSHGRFRAWTKEEDETLKAVVLQYGAKNWATVICRFMYGRLGKQCRERWYNHLDPRLKKTPWTQEEDEIVRREQQKHGNKWSRIAKLLPGRSDNDVKNRWYAARRRQLKETQSVDSTTSK